MAQWEDPEFLLRVWRRREASLMRILTARNLASMREAFDAEQGASRKQGLSIADFVRIMIKLLGALVLNKDELTIQILELFAAIDVNGDRILEWEELLNYIVEQQAAGTDGGIDGSAAIADHYAAKYAYRTLKNASADIQPDHQQSSSAGGDASSLFESFTSAATFTDRDTGVTFVLGHRKHGLLAYALRMGMQGATPVLMPYKRFRHDIRYVPHQILSCTFIPETGDVVSCSREFESGPVRLAFFALTDAQISKIVDLPYPCSIIAFAPSMARLYCFGDEGGMIYVIDVHSKMHVESIPQGDSSVTSVCMLPGHLAAAMMTGHADGTISAWDLRAGRQVPGFSMLAHDYGVRCLAYSEDSELLVTAGSPHPHHFQGLPASVYAVMVWDVSHWVQDMQQGDAYKRAADRIKADKASEAGRTAANNLAVLRKTLEKQKQREAAYAGKGASLLGEDEEMHKDDSEGESPAGEDEGTDGENRPPRRRLRQKKFKTMQMKLANPDPEFEDDQIAAAARDRLAATAAAVAVHRGKSKAVSLKPHILLGHRHPVTALCIQEEQGVLPHIVSVDESGSVRVWHLTSSGGGDEVGDMRSPVQQSACIQTMPLYPTPAPTRATRGAVEMGKAGLGMRQQDADKDDAKSPSKGSSGQTPSPSAGQRGTSGITSLRRSSLTEIAGSELGGMVMSSGVHGPENALQNMHRQGRRLSYSRTSVLMYPDKGEGQAEAAITSMIQQGLLDSSLNGRSAVVDAILRTGYKWGVGDTAEVRIGNVIKNVLPGMARQQPSPAMVSPSTALSSPSGSGVGGGRGAGTGGGRGTGMMSVEDVKSVTSSILSSAAAHMPEISARKQRLIGSLGAGGPPQNQFAPQISTKRSLAESAQGAAAAVRAQVKKDAEAALTASGVNMKLLGPDQKKVLLSPLLASVQGLNAGGPPPALGTGVAGPGSSSSITAAGEAAALGDANKGGRRSQLIGGKEGGNVLTAMLDLRMAGRRGSISDFALMLSQEARNQGAEDAEERRRMISEAQGGIKLASGGADGANKDDSPMEDADGFLQGMRAGRHPSFLICLPKALGGHEKRNLLIVGGERTGLAGQRAAPGHAAAGGNEDKGAGGIAARFGMRVFVWQQDVPDREPLISAMWLSPTLQFLTATASAVVLWDALTGRPAHVYDRRTLCGGREIMCVTVDQRQRKAIVGDSAGRQSVINLTSGAVMKELDPRATRPKFGAKVHAAGAGAAGVQSLLTGSTTVIGRLGGAGNMTGGGLDAQPGSLLGNDPPPNQAQGVSVLDTVVPSAATTKLRLPKYFSPILSVLYTQRMEVLSFSSDGNVWLCDESTLEGWTLGTVSSTVLRIYPMPLETWRALRHSHSDGSPAVTFYGDNAHSSTASMVRGSTQHALTATSGGLPLTIAAAGMGTSVMHASGAGSVIGSGHGSMLSVPSQIEGGPSVLTVAGTAAATEAHGAGSTADPHASTAAASGASRAKKDNPEDQPKPGQRDQSIRVSSIAVSLRLNLIACCVRVCKDIPHSKEESKESSDQDAQDGVASTGLLDEDSYTILMYDYERSALLGACARSLTDRKGGMAPAMHRGNGLILGSMKQDGKVTQDHFNAAQSLSSAAAAGMGGHGYSAPYVAVLGDEGEKDAAILAQPPSGRIDLSIMSDMLLPSCTAMLFLDPLAALLTSHDDGGMRVWACPPTSLACTLRMLWWIPPNPSNAAFTSKGKKLSTALAKRRMSMAAARVVKNVQAGRRASGGPEGSDGDGDEEGAHKSKWHGNRIKDKHDHKPVRRVSTVAGLDPEEAASVSQRRYAVSMCARPAHVTPPMLFGTLFPHGHAPYLPGGAGRLDLSAPAPIMNIFVEAIKRRDSVVVGTTGVAGPSRHGAPTQRRRSVQGGATQEASATLADGPVIVGGNTYSPGHTASQDGCIIWAGDTDGEIHRWFLSSAALAAAGLEHVKPQSTDDTAPIERKLDESPLAPNTLAVALLWSRTQSRLWSQRQLFKVACVAGLGKTTRISTPSSAASKTVVPSPQTRGFTDIPLSIHPVLRPFYAQASRQAMFPLVSETLPPAGYVVPDSISLAMLEAVTKGTYPAYRSGEPMPDLPASAMLPPEFTASWGGRDLVGPLGVVWEGSWRAHAIGDITSLTCIADSGVQALMSAGQDGLARIWDGSGRLLGTLDPQPRFTAPRPEWETPTTTQEVIALTIDQAKAAAVDDTSGGAHVTGRDASPERLARPYVADKASRHAFSRDDDGEDGILGVARQPRSHAEAVLAPLLSVVPALYGPGRGTGYSFDKYSMTHVCTERVYDGRVVFVPLGIHVPAQERPALSSDFVESIGKSQHSQEDSIRPLELGSIASGEEVPQAILDLLPYTWVEDHFGPAKLVKSDQGDIIALPVPPLPGLYGAASKLGFRLPESIGMPTVAVLDAGGVAARTKAVAQANKRRSSLSMMLEASGSSGGGAPLSLATLVAQAAVANEQATAAALASPSSFATGIARHTDAGALGSPRTRARAALVDVGVPAGMAPMRKVGVYYAALAPPQRQALWHLDWDLLSRRKAQLDGAHQALSLVTLVKMRDMSGWGRRHSMIASAARRLSAIMLDMAEAGIVMPRPPGWAEKEVVETTNSEAAKLMQTGVDVKSLEGQRHLVVAAVHASDQDKVLSGGLASVASRIATGVVEAVQKAERDAAVASGRPVSSQRRPSFVAGLGGAAAAPGLDLATDAGAEGTPSREARASRDKVDHGEAHAVKVRAHTMNSSIFVSRDLSLGAPSRAPSYTPTRAQVKSKWGVAEEKTEGPTGLPLKDYERKLAKDPVAWTLHELHSEERAEKQQQAIAARLGPSGGSGVTIVSRKLSSAGDKGGPSDTVSPNVRKAALASIGRSPLAKGPAPLSAADEQLFSLIGTVKGRVASKTPK